MAQLLPMVCDRRPQQRQACAEAGRDIWAHQGMTGAGCVRAKCTGGTAYKGWGRDRRGGEGLGAHPGPWHVLVPCFLGLGHSRRSIAGEPLPAVGVEFRLLGEGLVGGAECHAMDASV